MRSRTVWCYGWQKNAGDCMRSISPARPGRLHSKEQGQADPREFSLWTGEAFVGTFYASVTPGDALAPERDSISSHIFR
jgi:hypothetical protein